MKRSKRFEMLAARPVNQDGFVVEWPEVGLVAMDNPKDPKPSIKIQGGKVIEMDGKPREQFDFIDQFIADYAIDTTVAEKAMAMDNTEIARMLVDIHVSRDEVIKITRGLTAAKIVAVLNTMNVVEMMMAMQKMRARKIPSNQCHVTNTQDNPVLIAADAAEAALRGFDEMETTVAVVRYAPFNALSLQVGARWDVVEYLSSVLWKKQLSFSWVCVESLPMPKQFLYTALKTYLLTVMILPGQRPFWPRPMPPAA
ncbi:hypothetical protein N752_16700 [Desulforamulus aquiferis]|nr:hypothetical protein N752_16700 [Desulforamulus aquiferis]